MKTLIVFYSRTGRTASTARRLAHEMENTSRLEIVPMAYRGTAREYLHYLYCTLTRRKMEIDLYKVDFAKYDRIVLMIPVICGMMSAPMRSFILQEEGNLKNVEYIIIHKGLKARQPGLVRLFEHLAAGKARTPHHLCGWRQRAEAAEITQNFGGKSSDDGLPV